MKRFAVAAFCIIILFSISLPTTIVNASYTGYETTNYQATTTPVLDGTWTTDDEWTDTDEPTNLATSFNWREKWTYPSDIIEQVLVEFFTDNTNDADDYFQLCLDPKADGGSAPQTDDIRIDWVGHSVSRLKVYKGTGTVWEEFTNYTWGTDISISDSISTSPLNSNPHWIIEFQMDRSKAEFDTTDSGYAPWLRVAVYDASNDATGVQAWPPTSRDVPNDWGLETGTTSQIPEAITIASIVLLSSVAVVATVFLRKRAITQKSSAVKTGETNRLP